MLRRATTYLTILTLIIFCFGPSANGQKKSKVKIKNSDDLVFYRNAKPPVNIFWGNVHIVHGKINMYCDSVKQYDTDNRIEAFGNVHIINADTVHIYGDRLKYDGNTRLAEMRDNVKLQNQKVTVTTEFLDFDMNEKIGYYFNGGQVIDSTNVLNSIVGRYYTSEKLLFFKDSVEVHSNDYILYSDTLKYHTVSKTAFILGPTTIENEDETLYSEDGWYNTQTGISQFFKNTTLNNKQYQIKGDSIFLDKNKELARVFDNVELKDTVENNILRGNYLETFKNTEQALMTDSALFIQVAEQDSLFLHADTLRIDKDSSGSERIKAYHHVKFFRPDLQGKCDSLVYTMQDSTIRLFNNPILWGQGNQMVADTIAIETENKKVRYLHFRGSSFLTAKEDSLFYNQIKGKNMLGHVENNKIHKLDINGNGETLYYPKDKELITGMNLAKSSNISISIKGNKIDEITFFKKPDGNMYPLFVVEKEMLFLKDFKWMERDQPKSKEDIFYWSDFPPILSRDLIKQVEDEEVEDKEVKK